jgi:hypothetical protein
LSLVSPCCSPGRGQCAHHSCGTASANEVRKARDTPHSAALLYLTASGGARGCSRGGCTSRLYLMWAAAGGTLAPTARASIAAAGKGGGGAGWAGWAHGAHWAVPYH